ncbi:MAG: Zn-ribbon domain-containing OB-fold protein [Acidimicrobiales bacterium]
MPASTANGPPFRLLPRLDNDNRFFWTGGIDGILRFLRCSSCRQFVHPPVPLCPNCLCVDLTPEPVSGRGTVHSYTVNHQQWIPGSDPYVIGLVAIDEQPEVRLMTNLVGCEPDDALIGTAVEVMFEESGDVFLPLFRPVPAGSAAPHPEVTS